MASTYAKAAGSTESTGYETYHSARSNEEVLDGHDYQQDHESYRGEQLALLSLTRVATAQEYGHR